MAAAGGKAAPTPGRISCPGRAGRVGSLAGV